MKMFSCRVEPRARAFDRRAEAGLNGPQLCVALDPFRFEVRGTFWGAQFIKAAAVLTKPGSNGTGTPVRAPLAARHPNQSRRDVGSGT